MSLYMENRMVLMSPISLISLKCPLIECNTRLYDLISWGVTRDRSMFVLVRKPHSQSEPSYVTLRTFTSLFSSTDNGDSPTMKVPIFFFLNPYTVSIERSPLKYFDREWRAIVHKWQSANYAKFSSSGHT